MLLDQHGVKGDRVDIEGGGGSVKVTPSTRGVASMKQIDNSSLQAYSTWTAGGLLCMIHGYVHMQGSCI